MKTVQHYLTELEQTVAVQQEVRDALNKLLANTFVTYLIAHNFHWNVKGERFIELHKQFGDIYEEHWDSLDEIAERIRAVGQLVDGSAIRLVGNADIKESPINITSAEMVAALLNAEQACSTSCAILVQKAEAIKDQVSMDLGIKRAAAHDKFAWMLKSILGVE
jgi:starvation-inducible DNA-binding protein